MSVRGTAQTAAQASVDVGRLGQPAARLLVAHCQRLGRPRLCGRHQRAQRRVGTNAGLAAVMVATRGGVKGWG
jgi:hypothetical protein